MVDYKKSKMVKEGYKVAFTEGGQGIKKDSLFSNYQLKEYQFSISKCKRFRRALDIGGCYGIQSIRMAKDFATVEVFEPLFYKFLEYNTKKFDNVNIHPYALSSNSGTATMRVGLFNSGGSNITDTIDRLLDEMNLHVCRLSDQTYSFIHDISNAVKTNGTVYTYEGLTDVTKRCIDMTKSSKYTMEDVVYSVTTCDKERVFLSRLLLVHLKMDQKIFLNCIYMCIFI